MMAFTFLNIRILYLDKRAMQSLSQNWTMKNSVYVFLLSIRWTVRADRIRYDGR